ncbi:MAG: hypothetical protein EOO40_12145, partial [Deltaproteobacteria bacterium]
MAVTETSYTSSPPVAAPQASGVTPEPRQAPRSFILLFAVATLLAGSIVLMPFWIPIFVGATLAAVMYPMHHALARQMPKRQGTAAFLSSLLILLIVIAPILAAMTYAATELSDGIGWLRDSMESMNFKESLAKAPKPEPPVPRPPRPPWPPWALMS